MLFVLDVGNTSTVLGVFAGDRLTHEWRIKTDRYKSEDEFGMLIKSLLEHKEISFADIHGIIISSVVPPIMFALEKMCRKYFNQEALVIGKDHVQSYLAMKYPNPKEIGADRIVNAVGAIEEYGAPLVIIDFGTATTYCYVNEQKEYEGGVIAPGIHISLEALYQKASKLPKVEITSPSNIIGTSTVEAMQAGIYYGYIGQVDEVVSRIKEQAEQVPTVVATGGLAKLIADDSKTIDHVDTNLTLKGLYLIYKRNQEASEEK